MADNNTRIVITAEDRASAPLAVIQKSMGALAGAGPALGAALAGAFSVTAMASMIKGTIDAADSMNDLSQKVGISIQNLAGWQLAADQSGTSMEAVARGVKGLSGYMHDHAKELKAAGITATDADGAMVQLADIFKAMPDGVEKTALAVKLFGKAGMDMIVMLNQGSEGLQAAKDKAAEYGRKMAELAPQADQFNDTMSELSLNAKAFGINAATYLIGPMNEIAKGFAEMAAGGDKFWNVIKKIGDAGHPVARSLQAWRSILSPEAGRSANGWELAGLDPTTGQPKAAGQMLPGNNSPAEAAALARARLLNPKDVPKDAKRSSDYTAINKSLVEKIATQEADLASLEKLLPAQVEYAQFLAKVRDGVVKLTTAEMADAAVKWDQYINASKRNAAEKDWLALSDAALKRAVDRYDAETKAIEAVEQETQKQIEHNATLTMSAEAVDALRLAKIDLNIETERSLLRALSEADQDSAEIKLIKEKIAALEKYKKAVAAEGPAKQLQEQRKEWDKFTDDIERGLTDSLMRGFENGKDFSESFIDAVRNTLKTAALRIVVKATVDPVMEGVRGAVGTGGGGLVGWLSKLFSGNSTPAAAEGLDFFLPQAKGGAFASPDLHRYANTIVSSPTLFAFAQGGAFQRGLMGEAGPEAIMPLRRGPDGRLGVENNGGNGTAGITINLIENPKQAGQVTQRQESGQNILDIYVDRIRSAIASDITRGSGPVPAALGATYGLNRAAGAY